jgi:predicted nucleic acid-binding protein
MEDTNTTVPNKPIILLDSNIIHYSTSKNISPEILKFLVEKEKLADLAVSEYSRFELIRGVKKTRENELMDMFNVFKIYPISTEVTFAAARLETLYRMEEIPCNGISDGDKFIAATAILLNSAIMTANGRDFPWPFFTEIERIPIVYKEKDISKTVLISTFAPDLDLVLRKFEKRQ